MEAARRRVAGVVGTDVAVIAAQRRSADAAPVAAGIGSGAGVPVVAGRRVGRVDAAGARVASIVRADVAVVAVAREAADAHSAAAPIIEGAGIPVVASEEGAQREVELGGSETLRGAGVEDHLVEAPEGEDHAGEIEATFEELGRIEDVVPILVLGWPRGYHRRAIDDRTHRIPWRGAGAIRPR